MIGDGVTDKVMDNMSAHIAMHMSMTGVYTRAIACVMIMDMHIGCMLDSAVPSCNI